MSASASLPEQVREPILHLFGGGVGVGDGEDLTRGCDVAFDQPHETLGKDRGLAGTRPGPHQHGTKVMVGGGALSFVQGGGVGESHALIIAFYSPIGNRVNSEDGK